MRNRLLSALLVLLLCLLPACSPQQTSTDETGAVTTVEPAAQTFLLDARYLVIRGDTADESIEAGAVCPRRNRGDVRTSTGA